MPIYEYVCRSCEAEFEELVRMGTADADITCPSCGSHEAKRRLSVFSSGAGRDGASPGGRSASLAGGCGPSGFG